MGAYKKAYFDEQFLAINKKLDLILTKEKEMAVDLTALTADVSQEGTLIGSVVTMLQGLQQQIASLPADQAAIDGLASQLQSQIGTLTAATVANTPVATTPAADTAAATAAAAATAPTS